MKLLSRLFGRTPAAAPASLPPAASPATPPAAPDPPPPAIDPAEHQRQLLAIRSGSVTPAELSRLAVEGPTTQVRQAAAAAIDDPALWQDLLPRLRGKDKAAYKLIKQRSDALLASRREVDLAASEAAALCTSLEKLSRRPYDGAYPTMLALLVERWRASPEILDADVQQRGDHALERCHEVITAHERERARRTAEREADEARARERDAEQRALQEAASAQVAEQAAADAHARTAADDARAAEAAAQSERRAAEAQAQGEIASLIRLAGAALHRGDTRKAARLRQSIETSVQSAPALPPHLARALEQLDTRLNELRQWKDYVAAPKRIELIEDMEALIGANEEPSILAEQIRALRHEWRTINKGLAVDAPAEAERFEQAYQTAFAPCQLYFAEQAALRRSHLEARRQVLDRVLAFEAGLDAEHPDHPMIARVLREAPQEWRSHAPVDLDANRAVETEFHRALDRLRARVNDWHARNAADKQSLIARARQLGTVEDTARSFDELKRLQFEWKATGPVPHAQSQALWEEFRALCTALYDQRQQVFARQSAELESAKAQAVALCAQVEQAGELSIAERQSAPTKLREWQAAFEAIGELPRADARALRDRFHRALSRFEAHLAGQDERDAAAAESNLHAAARQVRAYQRAVLAHASDADCEALRNAAESFMAGVPRWPNKASLQAVRQALAGTASLAWAAADDAAREQALRRLCIRAEILTSTASPPQDAALRREHEMQLLRQGLGQARTIEDRDWEAMRLEWLGIGAVAPSVHDELERRFVQCLARRPSATSRR